MVLLDGISPLKVDDPTQIGEFRVRNRLGSGGMGRVFLGFSPGGRAVAIKLIHPEFAVDQGFRERFRREVAAARQVSGIYTAAVVAAGPDDAVPWLATAFVPGPSLAHLVSAHGPLAQQAVWRLAGGLAEALAVIHGAGLVHRDLKPANVLLAADGPRVIDFGISRALGSTGLTTAGVVVGTPAFMSPEQADGMPPNRASDVFALGAVLTFAATGTSPFGADTTAGIMYRLAHEEPSLGGMDGPLRELVSRCLARDPDRRPGLDVLQASTAAAADQPSATSFWPQPLADEIASYQDGLSQVTRAGWSPTVSSAGPQAPPDVTEDGPPVPRLIQRAQPEHDQRWRPRQARRAGVAAAAMIAGAVVATTAYAAVGGFRPPAPGPAGTPTQAPVRMSAPTATVCQADGTGCTRGGTYADPNALISTNDGGASVTWTSTAVQPYSSGDPLYWTAGMTFRNATSATLTLGCPAAATISEYMSGGMGDDGYVAAASTSCGSDPGWQATLNPGGSIEIRATFHNVPWPGSAVSVQISGVGASPSIYPFS